jgi:outer membrane protein OmpA-like peptidoglycan-associated protein
MRILLVILLFLIYWVISMPWFCNIRESCNNLAAKDATQGVVAPVDTTAPTDSAAQARYAAAQARYADSLAQAAAQTQAQITETEKKIIIRFPTGSSANYTDANLEATLKRAADRIKTGATAAVTGHSDNVGDPAANLRLSQRRADAIKAKLVANAASPASITSTGKGDTQPTATNDTNEGKQQNRRVEIDFN